MKFDALDGHWAQDYKQEWSNECRDEFSSDKTVQDIADTMEAKDSANEIAIESATNEELMQEHQKVTEQIQMWRMVATLQNKSTIGLHKARNQQVQEVLGKTEDGEEDALQADYFQPKDMTTIMEEMTATGDLTLTENSIINHSVDNESSSTMRKINDNVSQAHRER